MAKYADVAVAVRNREVDRVFQYAVPERLAGRVSPGARVFVPFGARRVEGYVIDVSDEAAVGADKLKEVLDAPDAFNVFTPTTLALAKWMSKTYYTTLAACLQCVMPAGMALRESYTVSAVAGGAGLKGIPGRVYEYVLEAGETGGAELEERFGKPGRTAVGKLEAMGLVTVSAKADGRDFTKRVKLVSLTDTDAEEALARGGKQADILRLLAARGDMPLSDIKAILRCSDSPVMTLARRGLVTVALTEVSRDVLPAAAAPPAIVYTPEQAEVISRLAAALDDDGRRPFLIHGVTGSGKTEVYMRLIELVVARGKQAVMLVPEIALTPQSCAAFAARFGDAVTVTHSRLSYAERFDQWRKAYEGRVSVMIGPRSAIFAPFANLGAVIVDEEHEHTYMSETSPKYEVKRVAEKLAELTGCMVVYGSATPDVGTYHRTETGAVELCRLTERVNRRMPDVAVADMRAELAAGNKSVFSAALKRAMGETLAAGNQAILFLNRRGHSTFVSCRACGYVCGCARCSVNYTYHAYNDKMVCHYCGAAERPPDVCPICGSKHIRYFGAGTQKIEEEARALFPAARVLRMDMDTTGRKNAHASIINKFAGGEADILVGTQMVAKGLNFPGVALVGVVAADTALNAGDFRSAETAFQLITQVSGRAGRADVPGRVIVQSYNPEHYSVAYAAEGDYAGFYEKEIVIRRQMRYPPFTHIFMVLGTAADEKRLIETLHKLLAVMAHYNRRGDYETLGPAPCVISKLRGVYRWKLLVKGGDEEKLKAYALYCLDKLKAAVDTGFMGWNVTLDPMTIQ